MELTKEELELIIIWLELHVPNSIKSSREFKQINRKIVEFIEKSETYQSGQ